MEFIDGASRLRGQAKALDVWRLETKRLGSETGNGVEKLMMMLMMMMVVDDDDDDDDGGGGGG